MTKRLNLTIPDTVYDGLQEWADVEGTKMTTLASYLVETATKDAMERGVISKPSQAKKIRKYRRLKHLLLDHQEELKAEPKLGDRIDALLAGEPVTTEDRLRLALFFNVKESDIEVLDENMKNGEPTTQNPTAV
ncbi:MAG: hypothetical protein ACFBSC_16100 [Microcoleaceae cyanobacterium]